MRFPVSSTGFYHYVDLLGIKSAPFPNPLTSAARSTVIDLLGQTYYAKTLNDLPPLFREVANAYDAALEDGQILALSNKLLEIATRSALKKSGIRWCPLGMKGHSMISLRRLMRSKNCHSITAKSLAK